MTATWDNPAELPDDSDDIDWDTEELEIVSGTGYQSPLMSRLGQQRLTAAFLSEHVPAIRAGEQARADLEDLPNRRYGPKRRAEITAQLRVQIIEGERAKESVFAAALPLIRSVAAREWRRRQQWGSQISRDDLTQEAIVGFFKGLQRFRSENVRKSATNYLGQWMLAEMRRAAEVMDHDLQVGHDTGERFRRVRALRSRLLADLGREPTDAEIAAASRDVNYVTRPGMVGRAPAAGEEAQVGKGLTEHQVSDERQMRSRLGHASRFAPLEGSDSNGSAISSGIVDVERLPLADPVDHGDPADITAENDAVEMIARLVQRTLVEMQLPEIQTEIVKRRYGLPPYKRDASTREIAREMALHRERVAKVLSAFSEEMTKRGGAFHRVVARIPSDDLIAIGLSWVWDTLGVWPGEGYAEPPAAILTERISRDRGSRIPATSSAKVVLAYFRCDYHDQVFTASYVNRSQVPPKHACPQCQRMAPLERV